MKKYFILAAIAITALASCTKDEPANTTEPQKITFEAPVIGTITKATSTPVPGEIESNADENKCYPTAEHFSVYAVYHDTQLGDGVNTTLYMNNVETAYNDNLRGWDPQSVTDGKAYYWPKNGYLTFAAYSPSGINGGIGWSVDKGFVLTGFTVASEIASQYDLMFSDLEKDNQPSSIQENSSGEYNGVQINFKHALSSIVFKAKTEDTYEGTTIKFKKLTIQNAYSTGNYTQGLNETSGYPQWGTHANETSYLVYDNNTGATLNTAATQVHSSTDNDFNDIILLPQSLTHGTGDDAKKVKVEIEYSIQSATGAEIPQKNVMELATTDIESWEMGKRYTYTIVFGLDKIYFAPQVSTWTNVTPASEVEPV